MVVQNQTSGQPVKLRLDEYDTILLDAHGVFLTDYQNRRKTPGFNYGECQLRFAFPFGRDDCLT